MDYSNIILEMLDRIKKLEAEVEELKRYANTKKGVEDKNTTTVRDKTRYVFNGQIYLKNRLVLAVVQQYVQEHPNVTRTELKQVFSKSLQGSIGVVEDVEIASLRKDCEIRFFSKEHEIIHLCDGDMYVCSQWGILNIPGFLKIAEQLGYTIQAI